MDALAIALQLTGLIVWPLMNNKLELWFIPAALVLISFHWWENYVADNSFFGKTFSSSLRFQGKTKFSIFLQVLYQPWHRNVIKSMNRDISCI